MLSLFSIANSTVKTSRWMVSVMISPFFNCERRDRVTVLICSAVSVAHRCVFLQTWKRLGVRLERGWRPRPKLERKGESVSGNLPENAAALKTAGRGSADSATMLQ